MPKILLISISICLLLLSCKKNDELGPCATVIPKCVCGSFLLLDRWGQPLIGEKRMYHPDSIKMLTEPEKWNLRFEDSLVFFNYGSLSSDKEYYLYLSSDVQDTITMNFTSTQGECFTVKNISDFKYSGAKTSIDEDEIIVIKF